MVPKRKRPSDSLGPEGPGLLNSHDNSLSSPRGFGPNCLHLHGQWLQAWGPVEAVQRPGFPSWLCHVSSEILPPFPACTIGRYLHFAGQSQRLYYTYQDLNKCQFLTLPLLTWKFSESEDEFSSVKGRSIIWLFLKLPALIVHVCVLWGKVDKHILKSAAWWLGPKRLTTS